MFPLAHSKHYISHSFRCFWYKFVASLEFLFTVLFLFTACLCSNLWWTSLQPSNPQTLRNREVYSKFVEQLNNEQPVLLDEEINSLSMQSQPKVIEKGEKSQGPICETIEQQPISLSSQVDLESFSQENTNTHWKVSEPSSVTSTMMPQ